MTPAKPVLMASKTKRKTTTITPTEEFGCCDEVPVPPLFVEVISAIYIPAMS